MELRDALIPAFVLETTVERDTHHVSDYSGYHEVAGRRRIKMTVELNPRNTDELNWLLQSLQENGKRVALVPDGTPIMHPVEVYEKAAKGVEADQPQTSDLAW